MTDSEPRQRVTVVDEEFCQLVEAEPVESIYPLAEVWQQVPHHVRKEIFGFMDLRKAHSLSRVDRTWKYQLEKSSLLNSGIVFLDGRVSMESRWILNGVFQEESFARVCGTLSPLHLDTGITHFVIIDDWRSKVKPFDMFKPFGPLKDSLKKLTVIGRWFREMGSITTANFFLDKNIELQLLRCRIPLSFPDVTFVQNTLPWTRIKWQLKIIPDRLVFGQSYKAIPAGIEQKIWILQQLDHQNLLWPYGEDQVEWLERSLRNLEERFRNYVKTIDREYRKIRLSVFQSATFRKVKVRSMAVSDERELDTLDCAFLARVLSFLCVTVKVSSLEPPPHPLPQNDIFFSC